MTLPDILVYACLSAGGLCAAVLFLNWATEGVIDAISDLTRFEERVPHSMERGPTKAEALLIACAVVAVIVLAGLAWRMWWGA